MPVKEVRATGNRMAGNPARETAAPTASATAPAWAAVMSPGSRTRSAASAPRGMPRRTAKPASSGVAWLAAVSLASA
jgi:hypothetical protein